MIRRDAVVEEVRKNREAIAREHGNDVDAMVAAFQREDAASGISTVSFPPRGFVKPATPRKAVKARRPNWALQPTSRARKPPVKPRKRTGAARA